MSGQNDIFSGLLYMAISQMQFSYITADISSRLHLRRSFLWKNCFCIISLAVVCKLVRWRGFAHAQRGRLVQFIFTLSRSPWMMKGPAEKTRMSSQHALCLLARVWCRFSWLFPRNTVLACVQLVWWMFWMRFCSLFSWPGQLKPAKIGKWAFFFP